MSKTRALIDTNVLIALEDPGRTDPIAAELSRRCQAGNVTLHIHQAMRDDFNRDRNAVRRLVSSSRMDKYPCLASIPLPPWDLLEERYGPARNDNDRVDIALLHALSLDAVDVLVTQDDGIHRRVRGSELDDRVLTIADAVAWLKAFQDAVDDDVALVGDVPAYAVDMGDPIFHSLEEDYPPFRDWWRNKCVAEHRDCWVIRGRDGHIDGLIVRKIEDGWEIGLDPSLRVLKLCTWKVATRAQGHKVGELLLRKSIWHAQLNGIGAIYLTTFPKQTMLIELLDRYGFETVGTNPAGELILVKQLPSARLKDSSEPISAGLVRTRYPRFSIDEPVSLFAIPVQWHFHRQLFPEAARLVPMPLFNDDSRDDRDAGRVPGNTIRKVYVCRSKIASLRAGDVIFFYQSKDEAALNSQSLTTVGVVEQLRRANDAQELIRFTAGRSVYSEQDLRVIAAGSPGGVAVIDFLLIRHLDPPIALATMTKSGVLKAAPQSITRIDRSGLHHILPSMNFGFAL